MKFILYLDFLRNLERIIQEYTKRCPIVCFLEPNVVFMKEKHSKATLLVRQHVTLPHRRMYKDRGTGKGRRFCLGGRASYFALDD